jgi:hypothetical protein
MARLTIGKRPDRHVIDHVGQDNKEDFSEVNLEYVTRSVNASRYFAWREDQAARSPGSPGSSTGSGSSTASGSSTTWVETVQASANEGKNERKNEEENNRKRKNSAPGAEFTQNAKFFKPAK